jgi:hypothetical protein
MLIAVCGLQRFERANEKQKFYMVRFCLKKLNGVEGKEQYQVVLWVSTGPGKVFERI